MFSSYPTCVPADSVGLEQNLGIATSLVSGGAAYALMIAMEASGLPVAGASAITTSVTNVFGYIIDILFAKRCFSNFSGAGPSHVLDMRGRVLWMLRSFFSFAFIRFVVTVGIDIIVTLFVLRYVRTLLNANGVLVAWRWRDTLLALLISLVNFHLFVNRVRFGWAYKFETDQVLDVVMISWFTSLLVSYIIFEMVASLQTEQQKEEERRLLLEKQQAASGGAYSGSSSAAFAADGYAPDDGGAYNSDETAYGPFEAAERPAAAAARNAVPAAARNAVPPGAREKTS
jgi:hypothetical protein